MSNDKRLIEDYLPIEAISEEAVREKSVRQGHISTIHLWWARRPLVACRAAVYATLVAAPQEPKGRGGKSQFLQRLCKHPGDERVFAEARKHVLESHSSRHTDEEPKNIRPKVLDLFSGGGAISLDLEEARFFGGTETKSSKCPSSLAQMGLRQTTQADDTCISSEAIVPEDSAKPQGPN